GLARAVGVAEVIPRPDPVEAGVLRGQRGGAHVGPAGAHRNQEQIRGHDAQAPGEYHSSMAERILVGTGGGLWRLEGEAASAVEPLAGRAVTALAREKDTGWGILDGTSLWQGRDGAWTA